MISCMLPLESNAGVQIVIHHYAAAVLAYDDLFALADLSLALGRNGVKTTAAGIAYYCYHGQAVPVVLADLFVSLEQTDINLFAGVLALFFKLPFFLVGFTDDLFQLAFFMLQVLFLFRYHFFSHFQGAVLVLHFFV